MWSSEVEAQTLKIGIQDICRILLRFFKTLTDGLFGSPHMELNSQPMDHQAASLDNTDRLSRTGVYSYFHKMVFIHKGNKDGLDK